MKVIALLYHDVLKNTEAISESGFVGTGPDKYKMREPLFQSHLIETSNDLNKDSSFNFLQAQNSSDIKSKLITFDDGGKSAYFNIVPLLEEYNLKGIFFIATKYIDNPNFLSSNQIIELHKRGHLIGSHSHSHPSSISTLSYPDILFEWNKSCELLGNLLGKKINVASVPAGYYSSKVAKAAKEAGIDHLFTSEPTSKVHKVAGISVYGRFNLFGNASSKTAHNYIKGNPKLIFKEQFLWESKKLLKKSLGDKYLVLRKLLLKR